MIAAVLRELSDSVSAAVIADLKHRRRRQLGTPRTGRPATAFCRVGASGGNVGASLLRSPPATLALVHAPLAGGGHLRLSGGHHGCRHHPDQPGAARPRAAAGGAVASAPAAAAATRAVRRGSASGSWKPRSARCTWSAPGRRCRAGLRPRCRAPPSSTRSSSTGTTRASPRSSRTSGASTCWCPSGCTWPTRPGGSSRTTRRAGRSCSISSRSGGRISGSCRSSTTSTPTRSTGSRRASERCWPTRRRARRRSPASPRSWASTGSAASTSTSRRFRRARQPLLASFMCELKAEFQPRGWSVSESVPLDDSAFDYKALGACTDRLILMAYDEHASESDAGPVASQAWFSDGVARRAADVPAGPSRRRRRQLRVRLDRGQPRARQPVVVPGGDAGGARV